MGAVLFFTLVALAFNLTFGLWRGGLLFMIFFAVVYWLST